jgi:hypothetical protein
MNFLLKENLLGFEENIFFGWKYFLKIAKK